MSRQHPTSRIVPAARLARRAAGLGLVEAMVALAITAALLTAVAAAFTGASDAVRQNDTFFRATHTARVALNRVLTQVRRGTVDNASTSTNLHLITDTGVDVRYKFLGGTDGVLQMIIRKNGTDTAYELARHLSSCDFQCQAGTDYAGNPCITRVAVQMRVKEGVNEVLLSGTGTCRRSLTF